MRFEFLRGAFLSVVVAAGLSCSGQSVDNSSPVRPSHSPYEERAIAAGGLVTSVDAEGLPRFVWAGDSQPAVRAHSTGDAAREHVERFASAYGMSGAAVRGMRVEPIRRTSRGDHLIKLVQEVDGIEIYRGELKVVLRPDLSLVALSGTPSRLTGAKPADKVFQLSAGQAVSRALGDLYKISVPDGFDSLKRSDDARDGWVELSALSAVQLSEPARARKVFYRDGDRLVAAYMTEFFSSREQTTTSDAFRYFIAAKDGRVLERRNLTADESFTYRVYARPGAKAAPTDGPQEDFTPHPTGIPDGSDPAFADARLVTVETFKSEPEGEIDPWLAAIDTKTDGNNVDAFADLVTPDGFSPGDRRATTTSERTFDYTYDHGLEPNGTANQQRAAVTNLFYAINWLHDYWYDSGFNEAAGNAQQHNFGRGGVPGDQMRGEAQDFAGLNNANMSTPSDGVSPRMQMFGWGGPETRTLEIDPGDLFRATGFAQFGPVNFDLTDDVVLAVDDTPPTSDGCSAITNDVVGRIVLIDRGTCSFALKSAAAEAAGAVGVIIANNVTGAPPNLANTVPPTIVNIPTLSTTLEAGNEIKALLGAGAVTARLLRNVGTGRSGALDNMVVAHEWGHYWHHRLTNCSTFQCGAMSEGWGDFMGLHTSLSSGDDRNGTYGMGIYAPALLGDSGYFGIRRFAYSVDPTKNALSFRHIQNAEPLPGGTPSNPNGGPNSEVHNAGEVWASMIWEAYVALQDNPNGRNFGQVKRDFSDYLVLGLQLAPTDATMIETRDAILAAVQITNPSDLQVLADAFAVRGAGSCASGPPSTASGDLAPVVESFDTQPSIDLQSVTVEEGTNNCDGDGVLDAGEFGRVVVQVANKGPTAMTDTSITLATATGGVTFPNGNSVVVATIKPYSVRTVRIRIRLDNSITTVTALDLSATVNNGAACVPSVVGDGTTLVNYDEVAGTSATETVEVSNPPWTEAGSLADLWTRVALTPTNHAFHGADTGVFGDAALQSPPLVVSAATNLVVTFDHAHSFEQPAFDGGVVEITNDGGANWQDVSAFSTPGYNGTISLGGLNPLEGRAAYIATNPSNPATDTVTLDFGAAFAGQTVQIRFRVGSDVSVGAPGWTIDDIAVTGIDNTPFGEIVDDDGVCAP